MPVVRKCKECGEYAMYGFGVDLTRNKEGRWYCSGHVAKELHPEKKKEDLAEIACEI